MKTFSAPKIGLVLTGGGARAAYQVGVLKAIAHITRFKNNPFRIVSGYSAGAINGTWLASHSEDFEVVTQSMWDAWSSITSEDIFNTTAPNVAVMAFRWIKDRALGGMQGHHAINYLLDTKPLDHFVRTKINFKNIEENIRHGYLDAVSVTAANYSTGHSVTFFSSNYEVKKWESLNRISVRTELRPDHVMASSAIPIFFPPVRIGDYHFGDGMIRLNTPLSAAVRLGAEKLMIIGIRGPSAISHATKNGDVSLGEIAGTILNGLFFDSLDSDLARMARINRTVALMTPEQLAQQKDRLRSIPFLNLSPSAEVGDLPECEINRLPSTLRFLLKGIGLKQDKGMDLLSYLSFEPRYLRSLLELGYDDTIAKSDQVRRFFEI